MKNKQKSLEDLDFLTELTLSEQEGINGGSIKQTTLNVSSDEDIFGPSDFTANPEEEPLKLKWPGEPGRS